MSLFYFQWQGEHKMDFNSHYLIPPGAQAMLQPITRFSPKADSIKKSTAHHYKGKQNDIAQLVKTCTHYSNYYSWLGGLDLFTFC